MYIREYIREHMYISLMCISLREMCANVCICVSRDLMYVCMYVCVYVRRASVCVNVYMYLHVARDVHVHLSDVHYYTHQIQFVTGITVCSRCSSWLIYVCTMCIYHVHVHLYMYIYLMCISPRDMCANVCMCVARFNVCMYVCMCVARFSVCMYVSISMLREMNMYISLTSISPREMCANVCMCVARVYVCMYVSLC